MNDGPGTFQTIGVAAVAMSVFLVAAVLLSLVITLPLKLLRGCTLRQSLLAEPEGVFFGITALLIALAYHETLVHMPSWQTVNALCGFAFITGLKSLHSLVVIWSNPNLGTVEVGRIIRH